MTRVDKIIDYEAGLLGPEEVVRLFQDLVDTGLAWRLQGHYGRTAAEMLRQGLIRGANDPGLPATTFRARRAGGAR